MEWGTKWRFIVWFSFTLRIGCEGGCFSFLCGMVGMECGNMDGYAG